MGRMQTLQDELAGFGQGERNRINRDYDRATTGTGRLIESRLLSRGLGTSSVLGNQLSGNTRRMEEGRQDELGRLGDRQIAMNMQMGGNALSLLGDRMGGRTQLAMGNQDRVAGYRQNALGLETQVLTGNAMSPGSQLARGNYVPGVSPSAAAGSTWGNALGAMGGMMLGRGGLNFDFSQLANRNQQPMAAGEFAVDGSYRPGSTLNGSNRPR
jgi:hypothetical protein